jgi:hypothetical protein
MDVHQPRRSQSRRDDGTCPARLQLLCYNGHVESIGPGGRYREFTAAVPRATDFQGLLRFASIRELAERQWVCPAAASRSGRCERVEAGTKLSQEGWRRKDLSAPHISTLRQVPKPREVYYAPANANSLSRRNGSLCEEGVCQLCGEAWAARLRASVITLPAVRSMGVAVIGGLCSSTASKKTSFRISTLGCLILHRFCPLNAGAHSEGCIGKAVAIVERRNRE